MVYRRVFQNIYSNRLRWHHWVTQREMGHTRNHTTGHCYRIDRSKSDIITHNHQNYGSSSVHQIPIGAAEPLPFDAIPCVDSPKSNRLTHLQTMAGRFKQLVTHQWENRFHEEIDNFHRQLGPIFRLSLGPEECGKQTKSHFRSVVER